MGKTKKKECLMPSPNPYALPMKSLATRSTNEEEQLLTLRPFLTVGTNFKSFFFIYTNFDADHLFHDRVEQPDPCNNNTAKSLLPESLTLTVHIW